jgi:hypothetical protein
MQKNKKEKEKEKLKKVRLNRFFTVIKIEIDSFCFYE